MKTLIATDTNVKFKAFIGTGNWYTAYGETFTFVVTDNAAYAIEACSDGVEIHHFSSRLLVLEAIEGIQHPLDELYSSHSTFMEDMTTSNAIAGFIAGKLLF